MAAQAKLELLLELKNKINAGLGKAKDSINSSLGDLKSKLSSFSSANAEAFSNIKDSIPGVGKALELLSNPYALITAAVVAFGAATYKAVDMALDWEKSMAKVNVTAQLAKPELKALSNQILAIGAQGSTELDQVPLAFNRIISAGLDVNTSLKALQPTLKAAKAGFTDVETVAAAGVGVMNSSGEEINRVYDILFATLNKGNAEFKDVAQYLPKIIPGARAAGFSLDQVAGAWAFLTAKGQTAEQSTTGLMNAFKALSTPKFAEGFKKIGVNIFDVDGKTRPLVDIITDLQKSMHGLTDKQKAYKFDLVKLDQEAKGAFLSMIQNVGDLKDTIDFTKNSAGQLDVALQNSATSTDAWKEGVNKFKVLMIQFGQLFLPIVQAIGEGFKSFMGWVMNGVESLKNIYNHSVLLQDIIALIGFSISFWPKIFGAVFGFIKDAIIWINSKLGITSGISKFFEAVETGWIALKAVAYGVIQIFEDLWGIVRPLGTAIMNIANPKAFLQAVSDAKTAFSNLDLGNSFARGFAKSARESLQTHKDIQESLTPGAVNKNPELEGHGLIVDDTSKIHEATQSKSIIVQIGALHQGDNVINQSQNAEPITLKEIEDKMNEIFLRVIRNVEASY